MVVPSHWQVRVVTTSARTSPATPESRNSGSSQTDRIFEVWLPAGAAEDGSLNAVAMDRFPRDGWICRAISAHQLGVLVTHQTSQAPPEVSRMGPDLRSRLGESNP